MSDEIVVRLLQRLVTAVGGGAMPPRLVKVERVAEALERLDMLLERGPTPDAFTFKQRFPAPEMVR